MRNASTNVGHGKDTSAGSHLSFVPCPVSLRDYETYAWGIYTMDHESDYVDVRWVVGGTQSPMTKREHMTRLEVGISSSKEPESGLT